MGACGSKNIKQDQLEGEAESKESVVVLSPSAKLGQTFASREKVHAPVELSGGPQAALYFDNTLSTQRPGTEARSTGQRDKISHQLELMTVERSRATQTIEQLDGRIRSLTAEDKSLQKTVHSAVASNDRTTQESSDEARRRHEEELKQSRDEIARLTTNVERLEQELSTVTLTALENERAKDELAQVKNELEASFAVGARQMAELEDTKSELERTRAELVDVKAEVKGWKIVAKKRLDRIALLERTNENLEAMQRIPRLYENRSFY